MSNSQQKTVNFLRGVPSEEALTKLSPLASQGYRKAIENYGTQVLQYGHFNGFKPLRDILGKMHGVDPGRIVAGNGGMEMISLIFKMLPLNSHIIVEEMTYDRVIHDAARYGHQLTGVKLTPEGLDIDGLKAAFKKTRAAAFYGIPFHQNPTGIDYSPENREMVENVCLEYDALCIWDICYEPLRYDGKTNTPITVSDWGPILVSSFTKTISPGTKCGYMVLPEKRIPLMTKIVANTRLNPNLPTQAFIADFIGSGGYQEYLGYLCELYKPRMDALNSALNSHFEGAYPAAVTGGFFSVIQLHKIPVEKEAAFLAAAAEKGIGVAAAWDAVAPDLRAEKQKQGLLIRLTFPACEPDQLQWGITALKDVSASIG
ncbi:MAG: PLP-dependent aminotransferase family protein [Desulfobacteraceae bacterium]|nr:MAG: PLP-dependent aminotransferase family protein [Desulfobacteraceae bacterium]